MRLNSTQISLIAPGCFSTLANTSESDSLRDPVESVPEPNDSSVIASSVRAYEQALAKFLHQPIPELGALPVAQHRYLFDTGKKAPHDGLEVLRTTPNNYYLTGMPASELDTWPTHAVANGKIADYLPRKTAAGDWRRLMTEVQMLFHAHPVNIARVWPMP